MPVKRRVDLHAQFCLAIRHVIMEILPRTGSYHWYFSQIDPHLKI